MAQDEDTIEAHDSVATTAYGSRILLVSATAAFAVGLAVALRRTRKERLATTVTFFEPSRSLSPRPSPHSPSRSLATETVLEHEVPEAGFSPVLDGFKALGLATLLCGALASGAVLTTSYLMDVDDIPSFSHRMRAIVGAALPALRSKLSSQAQTHDAGNADLDREWQAIWDEGSKIDAERAEYKRLKKLKSTER